MNAFEQYLALYEIDSVRLSIEAKVRYGIISDAKKGMPVMPENAKKIKAAVLRLTGIPYVGSFERILAEWQTVSNPTRQTAPKKSTLVERKQSMSHDNGPPIMENKSEVARILAQIRDEYEAAQQGLSGLSQGTPQHVFITTRMENMQKLHEQLQWLAGENIAIQLIADVLDTPASGTEVHASWLIQKRVTRNRWHVPHGPGAQW
jgi:hypothetical protein